MKSQEAINQRMQEHYARMEHWEPVNSLVIVNFRAEWVDAVRALLNKHGCLLEEYSSYSVVTFPQGTKKSEILPRARGARYKIALPDGTGFMELMPREGYSQLGFYDLEPSAE